MFLKPGALYYNNDDEFRGVENCFDIVEVLRWDLLISSPDDSLMESTDRQLLRKNWPRRHVDAITGRYGQCSWPSGISGTQLNDGAKRSLLKNYICRRIPSVLSGNQEEAVIVFASDNTHMPADMIAHPGFLMAFKPGALYSLDYDEFKSVPDTLELVEDIRWDLLITSPKETALIIYYGK
ncbi:E3 ubiquitin-protein ligase NRDP1-like [Adelges cooleyi]|uniref:E3 ubiquitin-protein ligase NRDP1-like n=1 Tax=Adelges cooleyi TaxID=133065 RepID=UPI0021807F6A|nr:E3 ubiquitin-protein ligase NRDP1-like [Adelges cooleyi]